MNIRFALTIACLLLAGAVFFVSGCKDKVTEDPEFAISNQEFFLVQDGPTLYKVNTRGTIENVGNVDVEDLVLTGDCPSCLYVYRQRQWWHADAPKNPDQKAFIDYLAAGQGADFEFEGLAFFPTGRGGGPPEELPDEVEIIIESYEVAR